MVRKSLSYRDRVFFVIIPMNLGAPGLAFETWETTNLHGHKALAKKPFHLPAMTAADCPSPAKASVSEITFICDFN
jgi:hypothetical protein